MWWLLNKGISWKRCVLHLWKLLTQMLSGSLKNPNLGKPIRPLTQGYSSRHLFGSWVPRACWEGLVWPLKTFSWWLHSAGVPCAYAAHWTGSWVKTKQGQNDSRWLKATGVTKVHDALSDAKLVEVTDAHSHTNNPSSSAHVVCLSIMRCK